MPVQKNLIAGTWTGGADTIRSINPSDTNDVVGEFAVASDEQVRDAVAAARAALPAWAGTTTQTRSDLLHNIGSELLLRKEELGELLAREEGKTRAEAIGEVTRAAQVFRFFAGETVRYGARLGLWKHRGVQAFGTDPRDWVGARRHHRALVRACWSLQCRHGSRPGRRVDPERR